MKFLLLAQALTIFQLAQPPDPRTPGKVRPELTAEQICATKWGVDRRRVTPAMRREVARRYGLAVEDIQARPAACCELDHAVPRSLGGADDVDNLRPQPWAEAVLKDRLEVLMDKLTCDPTSGVSLAWARYIFMTDWRWGYQHFIVEGRR